MVPDLFPFPGLRYQLGALDAALGELTAPPYDVIDAEARARLEASHPMNAVHLILPRDREPGDRYARAAEAFRRWRADGSLAADPPRLYLYRMSFTDDHGRRRRMTGVVGALGLSEPGAGEVLPHERTMPKPRGDRLELLRAMRANLDPVWGLSLASGLSELLPATGDSEASCVDADGVEHCLSVVPDGLVERVRAKVASAPVVIADGHHRYETALAYRAERGVRPGDAEDSILALVVELAEEQLSVRAIHRLLGGTGADLRARLEDSFTLTPIGGNTPEEVRRLLRRMTGREAMGLVDGDGLALLEPRPELLGRVRERLPEPLRVVDSARLEVALEGVGPRDWIDYHHDPLVVAATVAKGEADAGVLLRPVSVAQIDAVAESGERMPEKTTFFQPKPLTGLVYRSLDA